MDGDTVGKFYAGYRIHDSLARDTNGLAVCNISRVA